MVSAFFFFSLALRAGDLVLVRDIQKDKQNSRKSDVNWLGPRLLVNVASCGASDYVKELYGDAMKKYHLDDLKVYCERQQGLPSGTAMVCEKGAIRCTGFPGQRA